MSALLSSAPYGTRDELALVREVEELTRHHLAGCAAYARIWPDWHPGGGLEELPYLHVGVFKHLLLRTEGVVHERTLQSSSTTAAQPSRIVLDKTSSTLQAHSVQAILGDFVGHRKRPLLILDHAKNLRTPGTVSARMAAAMSLSSLATGISFLLEDPERPESLRWDELRRVLDTSDEFFVYGFTWMLWAGWCRAEMPEDVRSILAGKRVSFVHSGGWKKMEKARVDRATLDAALLSQVQPGSNVIDYYGLVEQAGVIYPLCEQGYRHVPVWAGVLVRSPYDLRILQEEPGQLQLINTLAYGAPYHSILTEDMGAIVPGACPCGRSGARFDLIGRMPGAELRGCANV